MAKRRVPAVEGLFTWPSESPQLIGSHCRSCGVYTFPRTFVMHRPTCPKRETEEVLLSRTGTLWSYTIQYYQPPPPFKAPDPFKPFALGAVELPEGIRVLGMLTGVNLASIKVGTPMELTVGILDEDAETEYLTWQWRPAAKPPERAKGRRAA